MAFYSHILKVNFINTLIIRHSTTTELLNSIIYIHLVINNIRLLLNEQLLSFRILKKEANV